MILKKLLLSFTLLSAAIYANSCPKWLTLPTGDITVVIPIYNENITGPDMDCDEILDSVDTDIDGDGVPNISDAFPTNSSESVDTDGDGQGNNADLDDDNDGVSDIDEITNGSNPLLVDTDGDGINDKDDIYPTNIIQAVNDTAIMTTLDSAAVNVLANDTVQSGETADVLLQWYYGGGMATEVYTREGEWIVINNQIHFVPNKSFAGGTVSVNYFLSDTSGHTVSAKVEISYPIIIKAHDDTVSMTTFDSATVNVLDNDIVQNGTTVDIYFYGGMASGGFAGNDGNWSIVGDKIIFTPSASFAGGEISTAYQLEDTNGHITIAIVKVIFPIITQAQNDEVTMTTFDPATIDVLANDTVKAGDTGTILLSNWNGFVTHVEGNEGNWTVVNNQVIFTPNANFTRGYTQIGYQLSDESGHISMATIEVNYPVIILAQDDSFVMKTFKPITLDVLKNDTLLEGEVPTVLLSHYGDNSQEFVSHIEKSEGNWTVLSNQVIFTPNANFNGGYVGVEYQLSDTSAHSVRGTITGKYPYHIRAIQDSVTMTTITPTTIDALFNDTLEEGETATVLLKWDEDPFATFTTHAETPDGNWTVTNNQVHFTPNENFNGGHTNITYQLSDTRGYSMTSSIYILYPIIIQAQYDNLTMTTIEPATVDVLANDTLQEGETGTVLLQHYGENGEEYVTHVETNEGNWTVVDNQVTFTPSPNFNGGNVYIDYQLSDDLGHSTVSAINIEFPILINAEYDDVMTGSITDPVTINVLENDTLLDGAMPIVLLQDGSGYSTHVERIDEGSWTVNTNQVTFTPSANFSGGSVWIEYQLSDGLGHFDTASINIDLI